MVDQDIPNFMWKGQGGDAPQNIPLMMFKLLICLTTIKLTNILQQRRTVHSSTVGEVKLQITGTYFYGVSILSNQGMICHLRKFSTVFANVFLSSIYVDQSSGNINTASPLSSSKSDSLHQKSQSKNQ
jgi:hypothetical protein